MTAHPSRASARPSPRWGLLEAARLWRLVVACWVVSWVAIAPALLLVRRTVFPALADLPSDPTLVAPGDAALILLEAARPVLVPFGLAVASAGLVLWAWAVLWHAGVVGWTLWSGGRRVRLGEVLGLGVVSWWRYARLSATALAVLAAAAVAIWVPVWSSVRIAFGAMEEERLIWLLLGGATATKLVAIIVWLATLHAAWLLGLPERRSAVLAWLRGLAGAVRAPIRSVGSWLVWLVPALVVSVVPAVAGATYPSLRGGPLLIGLTLLASLVRTFCWVGMFCSFAPVTGVVDVETPEPEPVAPSEPEHAAASGRSEQPTDAPEVVDEVHEVIP